MASDAGISLAREGLRYGSALSQELRLDTPEHASNVRRRVILDNFQLQKMPNDSSDHVLLEGSTRDTHQVSGKRLWSGRLKSDGFWIEIEGVVDGRLIFEGARSRMHLFSMIRQLLKSVNISRF
jgi:hypothetical protein